MSSLTSLAVVGVAIPELKLKPRSRPQSADMDHVIVTTGEDSTEPTKIYIHYILCPCCLTIFEGNNTQGD
jgi:hypothetical protein